MNPKLVAMLASAGVLIVGGIGFVLSTPQPAARTIAELRDAGLADGQKFILTCPERITPATRHRINRLQPGLLRPKQAYARVSRVAVCFNPDGGNCFRPSDGAVRVADMLGEVVVPSLRRDMTGASADAGVDTSGEETAVDDSFQYALSECEVTTCQNADAGAIFANAPCNSLNRLWLVDSPCRIPLCLGSDGGWDDNAVVDCRYRGPTYGATDGGMTTRWRGCNAMPAANAVGSDCVPVACGVSAGDDVAEEWR